MITKSPETAIAISGDSILCYKRKSLKHITFDMKVAIK